MKSLIPKSCSGFWPAILLSVFWFPPTNGLGGTVVAWGAGTNNAGGWERGQSVVPANLTDAIAIGNIGGTGCYSLALRANGGVVVWGDSSSGQINMPPDMGVSVAVAGGVRHCLALRTNGTVCEWGYTDSPPTMPPYLTNVVALSAAWDHSLALTADGTVTPWGTNETMGLWTVPQGLSNVVSIAAGDTDGLALQGDGTVVHWTFTFPPGELWPVVTNVPVPANVTNVVAIAASSWYGFWGLALRADGTVVAWPNGPTNVPADLTNVVAIAAGAVHALALKADGTVTAWGLGTNYSPGDMAFNQCVVPAGLTNVIAIAAGGFHSLALVGDGPPVLQTTLVAPTWSNHTLRLSLPTQSGKVYALEYKESLSDSTWTTFPLVAGTGHVVALADGTATNSQRFYRIRRW